MKQILHQSIFPAVPPPAAAQVIRPVFGLMEVPMKATAVAVGVACAASFNFFVNPKPPAPFVLPTGFQTYDTPTQSKTFVAETGQALFATPKATTPSGFQSYDTPTKIRTFVTDPLPFQFKPPAPPTGWQTYDTPTRTATFVGPDLGRHLFKPPAPFVLPTGFQTYDTSINVKTFVAELGQSVRQFVQAATPVVVQQTDWVPNFQTKVFPELPQALTPLVVVPTGWQPYNNQINFKTFTDALPFVTTKPTGQVQVPVFYHDQEYAFAKPYPIAVHLELSPFIPPGINLPAAAPQATGDGPPWHDTPKELGHLKKYREELARLQNAFAKQHRENVAEILRDVEIAAYGEHELIEPIERAILALPQLPKKSLFSVDLKSLKANVERARAERELAEDEEDVQMILRAFFS